MMYMPVVTAAAAEKMGAFNDYIAADEPLMAYELCFGELNDDVRTAAKRILDDGSKLWVNTIWASLCGGYEDDAADKADNPGTVYGPILDLGTSILQTDRPQLLISYLESKGRHSLLR